MQETLQCAIRDTQASVASIVVTRSEVYEKLFGDQPPPDSPGRLGGFSPADRARLGGPPENRAGSKPSTALAETLARYDLASPDYVPESFGSGVVINAAERLILTNYHVVLDATKIYVGLPGVNGSYADIYAADPRSDLAVLRLLDQAGPLKEIKIGDGAALRQGQFVVSLANPFVAGFKGGSPCASLGIVSRLVRHGPEETNRGWRRLAPRTIRDVPRAGCPGLELTSTLVETDAPLNLGSSGGVLVNLQGEMVGLVTLRAAVTGNENPHGFALPMTPSIQRIIGRLSEGREVEYGFLGVAQVSGSSGGPRGLLVNATPGSPASRAFGQLERRIMKINNVPIGNQGDLFEILGGLFAGSDARLELQERNTVRVQLAKRFVPGKIIVSKKSESVRGLRVDYTSVPFFEHATERRNGPRMRFAETIHEGVYVCEDPQPDSSAGRARLQKYDIITHVNGVPVNSPAEFYEQARAVKPGTPIELTRWSSDWHTRHGENTVIIKLE